MGAKGIRAGAVVDGTDWKLPAVVQAYGNGSNTVSATTFAVLPTTTVTAQITNPHPFAQMLVMCEYGAWLTPGAAANVRIGIAVSGSIAISAGIGNGGPIGWGEIPFAGTASTLGQHSAMCTYELPVSATAATFSMHAMRETANGTVAFGTIRLTPLRFLFD